MRQQMKAQVGHGGWTQAPSTGARPVQGVKPTGTEGGHRKHWEAAGKEGE